MLLCYLFSFFKLPVFSFIFIFPQCKALVISLLYTSFAFGPLLFFFFKCNVLQSPLCEIFSRVCFMSVGTLLCDCTFFFFCNRFDSRLVPLTASGLQVHFPSLLVLMLFLSLSLLMLLLFFLFLF